jgi:pimeloyl-ACP methyl ester carboxylesterase
MDTIHFVEGIELVRQSLDDGKLNFLGQSYGSMIGATYAEIYPEDVCRMVLDGITDHSFPEMAVLSSVTVTYEITLNKFFQWCNTTTSCALQGKDIIGVFNSVIKSATKNPIPGTRLLINQFKRLSQRYQY